MASDLKEVLRELPRQGWRVERLRGGHYMAFPPDRSKVPVTIGGTPSDHRAPANTMSYLRKSGFIWKGR